MSAIFRGFGAPLFLLAATATVAGAQTGYDRGHNEGVRDRGRPDYDAVGMPVGAFRLYPSLGLSVESDDNVFATQTGEQDDTIYLFAPKAQLRSQWSRHALNAEISSVSREYQDLDDESTTDWRAAVDGRVEILRGFTARADASFDDAHEARGTNDPLADPLREPANFEDTRIGISVEKEFGRIRLGLGARQSDLDFHDGTTLSGINFDQDFRDRKLRELSARVDLALSPDTALFVSYADRDHDYDLGNRDFEAQQALIGAGFDLTNLIRGEIGLGYNWVSFDNPALQDIDGFSMRARLDWFVTQLTNIAVRGSRDVVDTGVAAATSITREEYGVRVDHELRRNILLVAEGAHLEDDYEGIDRTDSRATFSLGADWLLTRWASIGARIANEDHESRGAARDRDFERTRASIGVTLKR